MDDGVRRSDVRVEAHIYARLSPAGRKSLFSDLEDMLIFAPGDLKSAPLSQLHLVTGPNVRSEVRRGLWGATRVFSQCADQSFSTCPFSGACPILHAVSIAAALNGDSAEESNFRAHHRRGARKSSSGRNQARPGGTSKRMTKLIDAARVPAEIRELMGSGP